MRLVCVGTCKWLIILTELLNKGMKTASTTGLNREEQVKVVIRLKPDDPEARFPRCVYLSERENELVVETQSKKELFVFDHIAHQLTSQADIHRMIGQEVVQLSFQGFNSCVFAYGQTGAGKTYSVMGSLPDLQADHYADTRGLLPRIVEDVFNWTATHPEKCSIICSYMEVYNQQIFDLLSPEKRIHQIREDFKRGVFVEGLIQKRISSYKQGIEMILEGEKTRRMASTAMNTESSRSHAIFTLAIESEVMEDDILKVRRAKLNIVDLAGSERVKHTHVIGEQLKEGCNINRSLHVLGNVINSLVQSAKRKKHIPFRDSKLTHYLKDSLGGNSVTKLLANIHTNKLFLGDTLSTLMFAKRAKSLKMKVEVNENVTENFDSLRKEVKRLREELAQARYFKGETQRTERPSFEEDSSMTFEKITENPADISPKSDILQTFEENELHYKSLIEVYEEHLATCSLSAHKGKQHLNMVSQWKNLEKKNTALAGLVRRFPAFTKIYRQNLILRQQEKNGYLQPTRLEDKEISMTKFAPDEPFSPCIDRNRIQRVIQHYQSLLQEMQTKFEQALDLMEKNYLQLEHECKQKDKRLKEFIKQHDLPPQVEQLKNQNEYLQLNILNLENQICQIHQQESKLKQEKREKRTPHRSTHQEDYDEDEHLFLMQSLQAIKEEAMKEMEKNQKEREETDAIIEQLRKRVSILMIENQNLKLKGSRCRSQKRPKREMSDSRASSTNNLKTSFTDLFLAEQSAIISFSKKGQSQWEQEIVSIHESHRKQIEQIKKEIDRKQKLIIFLKEQLKETKVFDKIQEEFGKNISQILHQYRQNARRLSNTRSMVNIHDYKEPNISFKPQSKQEEKTGKKVNFVQNKLSRVKQPPKVKKEEPASKRNSMMNPKKQFFSSK